MAKLSVEDILSKLTDGRRIPPRQFSDPSEYRSLAANVRPSFRLRTEVDSRSEQLLPLLPHRLRFPDLYRTRRMTSRARRRLRIRGEF